MDKVLQAAAMITTLLLHLGILHSPCKVTMNSSITQLILSGSSLSTSLSLLALSSSKCARHTIVILDTGWVVPFELPQGKKLVVFGLVVLSIAWLHGFQDNSMDSSFSASLTPQIGISLFVWAGFKVGHHCFKSFGQPAIEAVSFQLGHMVRRGTVGKRSSQNLEVSC